MNTLHTLFVFLFLAASLGHSPALAQAASENAPQPRVSVNQDESSEELQDDLNRSQSAILFNSKDETAWLNYYKAARYSAYTERSREINSTKKKSLEDILSLMENNIKGTWAWHVANYLHLEKRDEGWTHLREAQAIRPDEPDLLDDLLAMHEIQGNTTEARRVARKMAQCGVVSDSELEYNRNVLNSLEKNALLITNGFADTYPLYILQYDKGLRSDVQIISLEWMMSSQYRTRAGNALGIPLQTITPSAEFITAAIMSANPQRPVYLALTIPPVELKKYGGQLYCTGLALKKSAVTVGNMETLRGNWEKLFLRKHLLEPDPLNRNYLVPLVLLYDHYQTTGNTKKAEEIKELAGKIASLSGQYRSVEPYLR
jgi:hypothetical protein